MNFQAVKTRNECRRDDIAAYVDGELTPGEELELEMHFAVCPDCADELNQQKKLLCALDFALEEKEFELPENFTKVVVANAESRVSGLRGSKEKFNALAICSALLLLILIALGGDAKNFFAASGKLFDQFFAVGAFVGHLFYDIAVGTIVILRSLVFQFVFNSAAALAIIAFLTGFSALVFSRVWSKYKRI